MPRRNGDVILHNKNHDGVDRRGFLKCMAWAGTGALYIVKGGILRSYSLSDPTGLAAGAAAGGELSFYPDQRQPHGFDKAANPDVVATLRVAVERINAVPLQPEFLLHTGDISHLSKFTEFDTVDQVLREAKARQVFYVPGEHDVPRRRRQAVSRALRQGHPGRGLVQLRSQGCAFYRPGECAQPQGRRARQSGRGALGGEQLEWLEDDVKGLPASTPIVVFAHIPLGTIYADWGWGTDDSAQALSYLRRFGSVTVLNGHIHQIMQKVEGNITFHTATSTAFPQPRPGTAPSPGPMKVPAEQLRSLLGLTSVQ